MKVFKIVFVWLLLAAAIAACSPQAAPEANAPPPTETATATPQPQAPTETTTPTHTATNAPTSTPTSTPIVVPTETPTSTPPAAAVPIPIPVVNSAPNPEQICASLAKNGKGGLFALYVEPLPTLVWDMNPRQFRVGLCNSLSEPLVPESHFVILVRIPEIREGGGQTSELVAQFGPGLHELVLGSWTPGLENHLTNCVQKAAVEVVVGYSDMFESKSYRPLVFPDGSEKIYLPVQCGGTYS